MPVDLTIVESTTELGQTVVEVVLEGASEPGPAGPGVATGGTAGQVLTKDSATDFDTSWQDAGAGSFAPIGADYLVGTAQAGLTTEIVVGATPGGELGGTWASPTVDASHSGSTHAAVQAAAEATAAAALAAHEADTTAVHGIADTSALATDAELAAHESDTTSVHGIADTSALALTANHPSNATFNDHSARHEDGGADEISIAGLDGTSTELAAHLADAADAHDASAISSVAAGGLSSTDVQAALNELDTEKQPIDSDLTAIAALTTNAAGRGLLTLADPGADRVVFWDDSAGAYTHLTMGTNLTITDTTLDASGGGGSATADDESLVLHTQLLAI